MTSSHPRPGRLILTLLCLAAVALLGSAAPVRAQSSRRHPRATPTPSPSPTPTPTPAAASAYELPDPVATVNGEAVTRAELMKVATALLSANGRNDAELNASDKRHMYQSVLDEIITDRLISKASVGEPVNDLDVEKRFDQIRQQYPTVPAFEDALKKAGQTPDEVKTNITTQLRQLAWINKSVAADIKVEPLEIEKFYRESPSTKFDAPEMIRASHILVAVRKDAPPEAVIKAEGKVKVLSDRLAKGESFENLAKEFSDDPTAKQTGGDLDYFSHERIMPEFADAAFKLKIGEVSAPVRTQFGLHLIKLTDRKPAHTATLEEAHDQIEAYLRDEKRKVAVGKLVESLKAQAKIDNRIAPAL